ncbi:MAG: c-type cytochrome [Methylocystis sp.]|uniref:c-type cytochrome n=1 Tax=Methylocystis sp. TaxID=1911079 RepID=UPI003DA23AC6
MRETSRRKPGARIRREGDLKTMTPCASFATARRGKSAVTLAKACDRSLRISPKLQSDGAVAELFWIIKNGVKMTAMPAFGPTHQDEQIWNIVAFVRRLPRLSAEQFRAMESEIRKSSENEQDHHHQ